MASRPRVVHETLSPHRTTLRLACAIALCAAAARTRSRFYTCSRTFSCAGTPLICDVEEHTFGLSLAAVEAALASPKWGTAIVGVCIVSCYGVPARDTVAIAKLCTARGLWLVEDVAESYGAQLQAADGTVVPVGSIGDIAAMSIRSEKMVGCGEGGIIVSKTQSLVDKARWWCSRAPTQGEHLSPAAHMHMECMRSACVKCMRT